MELETEPRMIGLEIRMSIIVVGEQGGVVAV
jgi:hypothetical protein